MELRTPGFLLTSLVLLACAGIVVACGGGEGQSLEEYFRELKAVEDEMNARAVAALQQYPTAFEESAATRDYLVETSSIVNDALDALRGMDPPEQAQPAHSEFVDAAAATQDLWDELAGALGEAPSPSDAAEVSERYGPQLEAASARFEAACLALEAVAADNGIDVDLDCGEE
jgi:hypothetical protein